MKVYLKRVTVRGLVREYRDGGGGGAVCSAR